MGKEPIEQQVADHEQRIKEMEHNMSDFTQSLKRVDDSNAYLRKQNDKILDAIVERNTNKDRYKYGLMKQSKANQLKMFGMIFGASGLAFAVIELIIKLI